MSHYPIMHEYITLVFESMDGQHKFFLPLASRKKPYCESW